MYSLGGERSRPRRPSSGSSEQMHPHHQSPASRATSPAPESLISGTPYSQMTPYQTPSQSTSNLHASGSSSNLLYNSMDVNSPTSKKNSDENPFLDSNSSRTASFSTQQPRPAYLRDSSFAQSLSDSPEGTPLPTYPYPNPFFLQENDSGVLSERKRFRQSCTSFQTNFDPKTYSIETLHKHDDEVFLPPWKRLLYRFSPLFTLMAVGAYFTYYAYRIICTVDSQKAYGKTYVMAWLFIAAEGCVACKSSEMMFVASELTDDRSRSITSRLSNVVDSRS